MPDSDSDAGKCGYPTSTGDPCQNPATEDTGSCWLDTHGPDPADTETDGRGAPSGNENAEGNDGGAPDGNFNAVDSGLHMSVKRRLEWFKELGEPYLGLFQDYYVEYHGKAENKSQAAALASLAVIRDELEENLLLDGVFYEDQIADVDELIEDGYSPERAREMATTEKPKIATLEALDSISKEVRLGLKYEGVSGNQSGGTSGHGGMNNLWESGESGEV